MAELIEVCRYPGRPSVACVTLNRPEAGNAMDERVLKEIARVFTGLSKEKDLRAVVVRGAGKHFCAGADIEWMRRAGKLKGSAARKDASLLISACSAVQECPVPVIARVHGAVYGGGLGILAAADIGLAAEDARYSFSECRLGLVPAVISLFVLPKIGAQNARRYYMTAEIFSTATARAMGLVHDGVPEAELDARLEKFIDAILANGPLAVRAAKALLNRLPETASRSAREKLVLDTLLRRRSSAEGQEGLSAFLEKRRPTWVV